MEKVEELEATEEDVDIAELRLRREERDELESSKYDPVQLSNIQIHRAYQYGDPHRTHSTTKTVVSPSKTLIDAYEGLFKGTDKPDVTGREQLGGHTGEITEYHPEKKYNLFYFVTGDISVPNGTYSKRVSVGMPGKKQKAENLYNTLKQEPTLYYHSLKDDIVTSDKFAGLNRNTVSNLVTGYWMIYLAALATPTLLSIFTGMLTFWNVVIATIGIILFGVLSSKIQSKILPSYSVNSHVLIDHVDLNEDLSGAIMTDETTLYGEEFEQKEAEVKASDDGTVTIITDEAKWTFEGENGIPPSNVEWIVDDLNAIQGDKTTVQVSKSPSADIMVTTVMESDCEKWLLKPVPEV